jgi:hypothetical protein
MLVAGRASSPSFPLKRVLSALTHLVHTPQVPQAKMAEIFAAILCTRLPLERQANAPAVVSAWCLFLRNRVGALAGATTAAAATAEDIRDTIALTVRLLTELGSGLAHRAAADRDSAVALGFAVAAVLELEVAAAGAIGADHAGKRVAARLAPFDEMCVALSERVDAEQQQMALARTLAQSVRRAADTVLWTDAVCDLAAAVEAPCPGNPPVAGAGHGGPGGARGAARNDAGDDESDLCKPAVLADALLLRRMSDACAQVVALRLPVADTAGFQTIAEVFA